MNRGVDVQQRVTAPRFPLAEKAVRQGMQKHRGRTVDILFVNPPAPDQAIWIRSQHRVGRRSREGMIWPQSDLAQMAALFPDFRVEVIDAIPQRMSWEEFERLLHVKRPQYYVTQVTAPTLQNDMYGAFVAKSLGAVTIAFGTHVTPLPTTTMVAYPSLDYVIRGEPELTLRELIDTLCGFSDAATCSTEGDAQEPWSSMDPRFASRLRSLFAGADPAWVPYWRRNGSTGSLAGALTRIKGLAWRQGHDVVCNPDRPYIQDLDELPLPRHDLLPLSMYRAPLVRGPYSFVLTSRGCPGGCRFCIKHVSYGNTVRFRSPENVLSEIDQLVALGVESIHMYADLFTVHREQVVGICEGLLERGRPIRWTCNSRVDFVDEELLQLMGQSGCWMISWGIESGDNAMLRRMHKGVQTDSAERALHWAKQAGISNWGYFIIGLPGETEESIRKTIDFSKRLPLDLALFHVAAPHPGTPFFFEVVENGWFRPGVRWEQIDMDRSTVLDYPGLTAEDLERWARRAFREWAFRPRPLFTYAKMLLGSPALFRSALEIAVESMGWARGGR